MSVAIAAYNAKAHLRAAVASALAQSLEDIEVILIDDFSDDGTWDLVLELAMSDRRIVVDRLPSNGGPAVARNRALALARGEWFAVLDSDDLYLPDRLARLVAIGDKLSADVVADNLVIFDEEDPNQATFFLQSNASFEWVDLTEYLRRTIMYAGEANLGYLKPVVRINRLRMLDLSYDESLRIAEDDHLMVQMLAAEMRYYLVREPGYAYRRHNKSISHRLSAENALAILNASRRFLLEAPTQVAEVHYLLSTRDAAFARAEAFARLIDAIKARKLGAALSIMLRMPATVRMLRMPIGAALRRLTRRPTTALIEHADPAAASMVAAVLQDAEKIS